MSLSVEPQANAAFSPIEQVSPTQAWQALQDQKDAMLVDVRTEAEWQFSGLPDLKSIDKSVLTISLKQYPNFQNNPKFLEQLQAAVPNHATPLYFICKLGGRSLTAAQMAQAAGYSHIYNVEGGFEGEFNNQRQRGQVSGWKAAQLAWEQA